MTKVSTWDPTLEAKLSRVFTLIVQNNGELSDDTYIERLITAFGQEIDKFGADNQSNSFTLWQRSGAENLIHSILFDCDGNGVPEVQKVSIRLLGECLGKNEMIFQTACRLVTKLLK